MKKTLINLIKAYLGECQARNRYTYYAKVAKKQGYVQVGAIFLETAEQEKTHAKRLFEHIQELKKESNEDLAEIVVDQVTTPTVYDDTLANLKAAADGEKYENTSMYPEFAKVAQQEGYKKIASRMRAISKAEEHHEERYRKLIKQLENKTVFKKEDDKTVWVCRECGYIHVGKKPPEMCPSCDHPQAYYQVKCENY